MITYENFRPTMRSTGLPAQIIGQLDNTVSSVPTEIVVPPSTKKLPVVMDSTGSTNERKNSISGTAVFGTPEMHQHNELVQQLTNVAVTSDNLISTSSSPHNLPMVTSQNTVFTSNSTMPQPVFWINSQGQTCHRLWPCR